MIRDLPQQSPLEPPVQPGRPEMERAGQELEVAQAILTTVESQVRNVIAGALAEAAGVISGVSSSVEGDIITGLQVGLGVIRDTATSVDTTIRGRLAEAEALVPSGPGGTKCVWRWDLAHPEWYTSRYEPSLGLTVTCGHTAPRPRDGRDAYWIFVQIITAPMLSVYRCAKSSQAYSLSLGPPFCFVAGPYDDYYECQACIQAIEAGELGQPPPSDEQPPEQEPPIGDVPENGEGEEVDGECPPPVVQCPAPIVQVTCPPVPPPEDQLPPEEGPPEEEKPQPPCLPSPPPDGGHDPYGPIRGLVDRPLAGGPCVDLSQPGDFPGLFSWCDPRMCQIVDLYHDTIVEAFRREPPTLAAILGLLGAQATGGPANWLTGILGGFGPVVVTVVNGLLAGIAGAVDMLATAMPVSPDCDARVYPALGSYRAIVAFASRLLGGGFDDHVTTIGYHLNYACPTYIPGQSEVDASYLADTISEATWRCYTRANNNCDRPREEYLRSLRAKPNPFETAQLFYRNLINPDQAKAYLRQNGYIDPREGQFVLDLYQQIPPPQDIVRFMVRDAFDEGVVGAFGLDDEFSAKFVGLGQYWTQAQGISTDYMRAIWRSHWDYPSATQLFEMLHRNRPGRVAADVVVQEEAVKTALAAADVAPFWRDKLLNISYHPITRTDIQRAYRIGAVDPQGVHEAYLDEGYNDRDAKVLTEFTVRLTSQQQRAEANGWTIGRITTAMYDYSVNEAEGRTVLAELLVPAERVDLIIRDITERRLSAIRKKCIAAIRKRFFLADLPADAVVRALLDIGVMVGEANELLMGWECELISKGKEPAARMLCRWYESGLLSIDDFLVRLVRLGYLTPDAERIVADCGVRIGEKARHKAEAEARRKQQELQRLRRDEERREKDRKREQEKRDKEREKLRKACLSDEERAAEEDARCLAAGLGGGGGGNGDRSG